MKEKSNITKDIKKMRYSNTKILFMPMQIKKLIIVPNEYRSLFLSYIYVIDLLQNPDTLLH